MILPQHTHSHDLCSYCQHQAQLLSTAIVFGREVNAGFSWNFSAKGLDQAPKAYYLDGHEMLTLRPCCSSASMLQEGNSSNLRSR